MSSGCSENRVIWRERLRDGSTKVTVVHADGTEEVVSHFDENNRAAKRGIRFVDNGVVGGPEALRKAQALDRKLGVGGNVRYVEIAKGAYEAQYDSTADYDKWMKAHKRVNTNAGCGTPCPGDFRRNVPPEFYGMEHVFRDDSGI